jgi:hypothetical protein
LESGQACKRVPLLPIHAKEVDMLKEGRAEELQIQSFLAV